MVHAAIRTVHDLRQEQLPKYPARGSGLRLRHRGQQPPRQSLPRVLLEFRHDLSAPASPRLRQLCRCGDGHGRACVHGRQGHLPERTGLPQDLTRREPAPPKKAFLMNCLPAQVGLARQELAPGLRQQAVLRLSWLPCRKYRGWSRKEPRPPRLRDEQLPLQSSFSRRRPSFSPQQPSSSPGSRPPGG